MCSVCSCHCIQYSHHIAGRACSVTSITRPPGLCIYLVACPIGLWWCEHVFGIVPSMFPISLYASHPWQSMPCGQQLLGREPPVFRTFPSAFCNPGRTFHLLIISLAVCPMWPAYFCQCASFVYHVHGSCPVCSLIMWQGDQCTQFVPSRVLTTLHIFLEHCSFQFAISNAVDHIIIMLEGCQLLAFSWQIIPCVKHVYRVC